MRAASLNHVYRLVWDKVRLLWIAVAETSRSHGKSGRSGKAGVVALCSAGVFGLGSAWALPTDGHVSAGQGQIGQSGHVLTVNQSSQNLALNWQSFNIADGEQVRFNQPSSSAIALNRVVGQDASSILGSLSANGQVFLVNPNGVLFGQSAQVSVGGLVASTLNLTNQNFLNGRYTFSGSSTAAVSNSGHLSAAQGGYVALLGASVTNNGQIAAPAGNVSMAAGQRVTLNLDNGSLLGLSVNQGAVDAIAANHGLISANGGKILLTAEAADALTKAVVNNTGIIEAQTIDSHNGSIRLIGDMSTGSVQVGGTLDASAAQGNGGKIETSAAHVAVADSAHITTQAAAGKTGTWLIDPTDFSVDAGTGAQTSSGIGATTLSTALNTSNVSIVTAAAGGQAGDINVNAAVTSASTNQLSLTALGGINLNAALKVGGDLVLNSAGAVNQTAALTVGGATSINAGAGSITLQNANNVFGGLLNLSSKSDVAVTSSDVIQLGTTQLGGNFMLGTPAGIVLNNSVNSKGGQYYFGDVSLGNDIALTTSGNAGSTEIMLAGNVDGAHSLTVDTAGSIRLGGVIGGVTPLSSLTVVGQNTQLFSNVTTVGNQTYTGPINLSSDVLLSSQQGKVTFVGTIDNQLASDAKSLTVNAPHGAVTFVDKVGSLQGALTGLNVNSLTFSAGGATNSTFLNIGNLGLDIIVGSGSVTQNGAFAVTGPSSFITMDGSLVNLTNPANHLLGPVFAAGTGILISNADTLNISGLNDGPNGEVRLVSGGGLNLAPGIINTGISGLTLIANGGALTTVSDLNGGVVTLSGDSGLNINNSIKALFGLNLISHHGAIIEGAKGVIAAPSLALSARDNITLDNPLNKVDQLASANGAHISLQDANSLNITGNVFGQTVNIRTDHRLKLDAQISASGTGKSIVLVDGQDFTNTAGFNALTASNGNWQVWSVNPETDSNGGLTPDFVQYNIKYGSNGVLGSGNGMLYSVAPFIDVWLIGETSKVYDGTKVAKLDPGMFLVTGNIALDEVVVFKPTTGLFASPNVGEMLSVTAPGVYIISAKQGSATVYGYQLVTTSPTGYIGTITQAPLTISGLFGTDRPYNGSRVDALTGTAVLNGLVPGETLTLTQSTTGLLASPNAGSQPVTVSIGISDGKGLASNYKLTAQPTLPNVNITPINLTVTGLAGTDRDYNGSNLDFLTGTGVLHGLIGDEQLLLNNVTTASLSSPNAGKRSITTNLTLSNDTGLAGNYTITQPTLADVTINPAKLIVTGLSGTNRRYDGTTVDALTGTASLFGLIGNETLTMENTAMGVLDSADVGTRGVKSAVTLADGTGLASNYVLTQATMPDVTISPAILTVSGLAGTDRTYDGTTIDALTGTAILSGLVNGETLKVDSASTATGDLSSPNAGSRAVTTHVSLLDGTGKASNYTLTQATLPNVNISPAILTVSGLSGTDRAYNGSVIDLLQGTGTLTGLVNGESLVLANATTGTLSSANAGTRSITTDLKLTDGTGLASNYTLLQPTLADVTISRAKLVVTGLSGTDRSYNGTTVDELRGTASLFGLVGDETLTMSNTTQGVLDSPNVGSRKVSTAIVLGDGTGLASNYTLDQQTLSNVNITPAFLSLSGLAAQDKTYDGTKAAVVTGGTLSGTIYGNDQVQLSLTAGEFASANAGKDIAVTASGTLSGDAASNYVLLQSSGLTATINPKALTVTGLLGTDRRYDGTTVDALTGIAVLHGLVGEETLNVGNAQSGTLDSANVGSRSVTTALSLADGTGLASNYTLTQATLPNVNITPALLTVTGLAGTDRAYDGTTVDALTGTATLVGLVGSETLNVGNAQSGTLSTANAGSRGVTTSLTLGDGTGLASNYELTQPTLGNVNITKALLTVTANDAQRSVGATNPLFTATTTGFVAGENGSVLGGQLSFNTPATQTSPAGIYGITPSGLSATNYAFQYVDGHLTIVPTGLGGNNLSVLASLPNPERNDNQLPEALPSLNLLHVEGTGISLPNGAAVGGL